MLKLGWLATGRGEGSRGFLNLVQGQIESGALDAKIEFVFSNREQGEAEGSDMFFDQVKGYGLSLVTLSSKQWRREHGGGPMSGHRVPFHDEVMRLISGYRPDICVLAGYMLITSPEMCRRYPMVNLHPALPSGPTGTWQEVIWELIEHRADESGVMVHVATEVLDSGPVMTYCSFPIRGGEYDPLWKDIEDVPLEKLQSQDEDQPLFARIRQEGMQRERPLLLETLRAMAQGRLRIVDNRVVDADGAPAGNLCLDGEVERFLETGGI